MTLSIIIPAHNVSSHLQECIDSVLNQNLQDYEIILVDDGSTDGTAKICDDAASQHNSVKVTHQSNQGLSCARNIGLKMATGTYVLFVDGDDYLASNCLDFLIKTIEQAKTDVLQFGYEEVPDGENKTAVSLSQLYVATDRKEMFCRLYQIGGEAASACTKLYKREIFDRIQFEHGKMHEDEYFATDLICQISSMAYVTHYKPYRYRIGQSTISHKYNPARFSDLMGMYHKRLGIFDKLHYEDLIHITRARMLETCILWYIMAKDNNDDEFAHEIAQFAYDMPDCRVKYLSNYRIAICQRLISVCLPGLQLYYWTRKVSKACFASRKK